MKRLFDFFGILYGSCFSSDECQCSNLRWFWNISENSTNHVGFIIILKTKHK